MADLLMGSPFASAKVLSEDAVDTLFCSIECMKNPIKYIEYTRAEYSFYSESSKEIDYNTEKITAKVIDYYSKDTNDIALLIDFITKLNKERNEAFNLSMNDIKLLLENTGNFFTISKKETKYGLTKSKIQLRPIELKSV